MENQSMCVMSANVLSPCNHIISEYVSARKQGRQSLVCLHDPHVHIHKGVLHTKKSRQQLSYLPLFLMSEWRKNFG